MKTLIGTFKVSKRGVRGKSVIIPCEFWRRENITDGDSVKIYDCLDHLIIEKVKK